ncbi:S-layer homology domain-containing protein [Bacillus sp. AFS015802]|uniref:S-layer homology domain-containing protein n=1 Tax=Bacillus sp. AFS015802 TaxID=2033486 RepID=UPI0015CF1EB2|nr:S-layer homology domain-containing protein [Bacillus sp. AFS015802]
MHYIRTGLIILLSFLLGVGAFSNNASANENSLQSYYITDMDVSDFGFGEVNDFVSADIIDGFLDSKTGDMLFQPNKNITRAEFTKILINAMGIETNSSSQIFKDVSPNKWYFDYINTASSLGIVNGFSPDQFQPGSFITRGQMAAMIVRAFEDTIPFPASVGQIFPDVPSHTRFADEINKAASLGIIQGHRDNTFKPGTLADRVQAVVIMFRALSNETESSGEENDVASFVQEFLTNESEAFSKNISIEVYNKYTTGFYNAYATDIVRRNNELIDQGYEVTLSSDLTNMKISVEFLTNRFAEVKVTGTSNYGKFVSPEGKIKEINSTMNNGYYFLKKTEKDGWKIYDQYPEESK